MSEPRIVTRQEWAKERTALLEEEKSFLRSMDRLNEKKRSLPWVEVTKTYVFEGEKQQTLLDLFQGRSQLIIYHFMFDPSWKEGCKSCSFIADHYNASLPHLKSRDVSLVTVSRAPFKTLQAFKERMGWTFPWVSSENTDFNADYHVSKPASGEWSYNYAPMTGPVMELPGLSVFSRREKEGPVYHTFSTYGRGLDLFMGAYRFLDIVPKGRDEEGLPYSMAWLRLHDSY